MSQVSFRKRFKQRFKNIPAFIIRDLWSATLTNSGFSLYNIEFLQITLYGVITRIKQENKKIIFTVDDATGTISCLTDLPPEHVKNLTLGCHIRLIGKLRNVSVTNSRYIWINKIELYDSMKQRIDCMRTVIDLYENYYLQPKAIRD